MPSSTGTTVAAPLNAAKPALEDFGPEAQLLRAGPCGSSPTVPTVPLARRHRHQGETFTVSVLHSWACPTAANRRAQRGEAAVHRRKLGVGSHCHAHFPAKVKRSPPTNVASADAAGRRFVRKKERFVPNSRACRRQLLLWTSRAVKLLLVTGKRGRRRRDMGRGPLGPVQSMSNMHTDQGVSRRGQPVGTVALVR